MQEGHWKGTVSSAPQPGQARPHLDGAGLWGVLGGWLGVKEAEILLWAVPRFSH